MSFELDHARQEVCFDARTGQRVQADAGAVVCVLDIHTNISMNLGPHKCTAVPVAQGNFTLPMTLEFGEAVAVTGLASCGAVIVANADFSRVAAGHMSGDAQFAGAWCAALEAAAFVPRFLLWGTGPSGSRKSGGSALLQYMDRFKIPPSRAPAVAGCGALMLARLDSGIVGFASYSGSVNANRSGYGVHATPTQLPDWVREFMELKDMDGDALIDRFLFVQSIARFLLRQDEFPMSTDPARQKSLLAGAGRRLVRDYYARLDAQRRPEFKRFRVIHDGDWSLLP